MTTTMTDTLLPTPAAQWVWEQIRAAHNFGPKAAIVKVSGNAKLDAEMGRRPILLASHTMLSGRVNGTCTNDSLCASDCVVTHSFHGTQNQVVAARAALTTLALEYPDAHAALLLRDIHAAGRKARRLGVELRLRLNVNSDLDWENRLPDEVWEAIAEYGVAYDYTKRLDRVGWLIPGVYRTSYSATSATRPRTIARLLDRGDTVTLVLPIPKSKKNSVPDTWAGRPMVSGDASDDRSADPEGVFVGLMAKGNLIKKFRKTGQWGPLVTNLPATTTV